MSRQTTLLTSHKGVDLHAATASLVMKDRLAGGESLVGLFRCEVHAFWGEPAGMSIERLLDTGRYFNPNKHYFGHFESGDGGEPWFACTDCRGRELGADWPGVARGTDLTGLADDGTALYHGLLGGRAPAGYTAVDVVAFGLGQDGPVLSGVLWRLVIQGDAKTAAPLADQLAVARSRKEGLLVNPHMEGWLIQVHEAP